MVKVSGVPYEVDLPHGLDEAGLIAELERAICKLDKTGVYCVSCFRLMSEIEDWPKMDDTQKAFVVAASELRRIANEADKRFKRDK
jgi:predicted Fe-S protein YdhL (DUF1289 family)